MSYNNKRRPSQRLVVAEKKEGLKINEGCATLLFLIALIGSAVYMAANGMIH